MKTLLRSRNVSTLSYKKMVWEHEMNENQRLKEAELEEIDVSTTA